VGCGVLLACLRAAAWSGAEGAREGCCGGSPLTSMSHGRVWAGVRGRRQQDTLGEAGTLWEGQRGGWLLVLVLTCTFADFCPPCVRPNVRKKSKFEFSKFSSWVGHYIG
jgi:hypothetical protein